MTIHLDFLDPVPHIVEVLSVSCKNVVKILHLKKSHKIVYKMACTLTAELRHIFLSSFLKQKQCV